MTVAITPIFWMGRADKMKRLTDKLQHFLDRSLSKIGLGMRTKLIVIFGVVNVIPIVLLTVIVWNQIGRVGQLMRDIAVTDSSAALNANAVENIERMTTDTAQAVAQFLYARDDDILYLAQVAPNENDYRRFAENKRERVVHKSEWVLEPEKQQWVPIGDAVAPSGAEGMSTNSENNDMDGFHYRKPENFDYIDIPLYDEISYFDLQGNELVKYVSSDSSKKNYPLSTELRNISRRENTYVKAETYFAELQALQPGDIYVSDVTGAYVASNYIGMYAPEVLEQVAQDRGYDIPYAPEEQAYAGEENPNGQRFEGIVRWVTPVADAAGQKIGYVSFALNHDHIMEFVDHITPMNERYTELPSAFEGNYAFIWDYQCRSICHPRHHSIVGFNPETGEPETPWLETSIYEGWQESGVEKWTDYVKDIPVFDQQSRSKAPAAALTKEGLVGLDGRYLNNAPQCTGWMDLTKSGGSGSFYILWSGLYKLTTSAAIPYYTGQYAPSPENDYSMRGFGFVAIGAGLEDFSRPAQETQEKLDGAIDVNLRGTFTTLVLTLVFIIALVALIAIALASFITGNISNLINGISRFRSGERQFRFATEAKDEFGTLADSFDDMADSIVDSVKNPLAITDMNQTILYMNQARLDLNSFTLEDAVGQPYAKFSIFPTGGVHDPILALEQGAEAEIYYLEEADRYFRGVANYFLDKEGNRIGYFVLAMDVTEMTLDQLALENAVNEANRANQHKGEFLARMSHEIRTPMNAIIGLANIVERRLNAIRGKEVNEVKEHVQKIEASSQHLLGLLNDILDLSKIEAGKIELVAEEMDLAKLVSTVSTIIKPRCDEKNIEFVREVDDFSEYNFIGDSLRLRQVLINLLGNAVKFTGEMGTVRFRMGIKERNAGQVLVEFTVADTGIGISEERVKTIFQPFEQADLTITRKYGGTGLGLSISRYIVQLFGGEIRVSSQIGTGSEFSFAIWLPEAEKHEEADAQIVDLVDLFRGRRALLVDDVEINRMIVMALLENTGMEIVEAVDGNDAVEKFAASAEGDYDIIFMDIQMPNMNGYEASDAIRGMERGDAKRIPIVALTANAFKEDMDKAREHGMNAHITKPVDMDRMAEILLRFVPKTAKE